MTPARFRTQHPPSHPALFALAALAAALAFLASAPPAQAQGLGPRTIGNPALRLDAGAVGDQLSISASDSTTHKMELTRAFKVGAVVPRFEGEAYGAVYRGLDFLFFVVQKKHPAPAAG